MNTEEYLFNAEFDARVIPSVLSVMTFFLLMGVSAIISINARDSYMFTVCSLSGLFGMLIQAWVYR